jgi:hypothetical protein
MTWWLISGSNRIAEQGTQQDDSQQPANAAS